MTALFEIPFLSFIQFGERLPIKNIDVVNIEYRAFFLYNTFAYSKESNITFASHQNFYRVFLLKV
jgi:hypothetical protein